MHLLISILLSQRRNITSINYTPYPAETSLFSLYYLYAFVLNLLEKAIRTYDYLVYRKNLIIVI